MYLLCFINIKAQEFVGLSMGASYAYDIYYSLTDGITATPERANWDLAFSTNPSDNNIRINSGNAVRLYEVSNDINEWGNITSLNSNALRLKMVGKFLHMLLIIQFLQIFRLLIFQKMSLIT